MKVEGISPGEYEYNFRIGDRVDGGIRPPTWCGDGMCSAMPAPGANTRCGGGFASEDFDWGEDQVPLAIPYEDVIAYHLHVRALRSRKTPESVTRAPFWDCRRKIPYLKELGINQVILMPALRI